MSWDEREDTTIYQVVVNHEGQYSIWPAHREPPPGWVGVGRSGSRAECLAHIEEVWTDMRPLSVRQWMEGQVGKPREGLWEPLQGSEWMEGRVGAA